MKNILLIAAALLTTTLVSTSALANTVEGTNLSVHMESAHFSGAGDTVAISRLPITNEDTGKVGYYDITAKFSVNANGELVFDKISSMSAVSFANANMLLGGDYVDEHGCDWVVSQPAKDKNGSLIWSLGRVKNKTVPKCNLFSFRVSDAPVEKNHALSGLVWCKDGVKRSQLEAGLIGAQDEITYQEGGIATATQSGTFIGVTIAKCSRTKNDDGQYYGGIYDPKTYNLRPRT